MSVRKRTWTTKGIEHTGWQVDYLDQNGVRRRKLFSKAVGGKTARDQARDFDKRAGAEVLDGTHVPDSETITIAEAGKLWLKSGAAANLERSTLDQRDQHLRLHIGPLAGTTKLNKITTPWVRSFQDDLRESGRSTAMIKRITVSLGSILADAQGRGLVVRNAVHEMSRARSGSKAQEKRSKAKLQVGIDLPSNDEVRAILAATTGRYRAAIVTLLFTGLRSSELRALFWEDVDLKKALVTVRRRVDRYGEIGMPKSEAGQRTIPLLPMVVNVLREWKLACPKSELGLVFPTSAGTVEPHQNLLQRGWMPTLLAAGVSAPNGKVDEKGEPILVAKYSGLHAARHWFASWCANRKEEGGLELSPKQLQTRMGHSSIQVTYDTYASLFPIVDEAAAMEAAQSALLGRTSGT
ncbi:tyrosine-type recombinase/integrase [Devosia sp. D6-9]|nr:tyrosine-type recombinase/integrase [Devosia sp. D6-9]